MKKASLLLSVVILLALVVPASADVPGPGGPFNSAFTIQNLDTTGEAVCMVEVYDTTGVASGGVLSGITISAGGNYFVYVPNAFGSLADGRYSAIVLCDREVAVVSNFSDADSGAAYGGFATAEVANTLYAPGLYKSYYGYNSNVVVQNAGTAPATIDFTVYAQGNPTPVLSVQETDVAPGTSVSFDQATQALPAGLLSAVIEGSEPIAAVGQINNSVQMYSYNGFAGGSLVAYAPSLFNRYYGWSTSVTVLNMGTGPTDLTVTYSNGVTENATIGAKDFFFSYTPNVSGINPGTLVSARFESTLEPIVVLVNESNAINRAASYNGFAAGAQGWVAPIIMKSYYGYDTSITCQNISGGAADVTVTYSNGWSEQVLGVAAGQTALFYQPNAAGLPAGFNGSATIASTADVVCIVNENQEANPASGDWLFSYNAIPQAP